ncbi:MAG: hypothetical protein ACR2P0_02610 [Acidimicrobiales bacterium]
MAKVKYKTVGSGTFWSPALESDGEYELLDVLEHRAVTAKAVRCVRSQEIYDLSVLTRPTDAQLIDQIAAGFREIGAWLVAASPENQVRQRTALREIRRTIRDNYVADDLDRDMAWIASSDFTERIAFLRDHLIDEGKEQMVRMAGHIASVGCTMSHADAEFIESLGVGLGLDVERVLDLVVAEVNASEEQAAA